MVALENDKGGCPAYLPSENILTYVFVGFFVFVFQNDDLIFKQKGLSSIEKVCHFLSGR